MLQALRDAILPVLHPFATLFRSPTWLKAQILLVGAIQAPGQRPWLRRYASWDSATTAGSLPPGAQSGGVVAPSGGWHPARAAAPASGPGRWSVDLRHRRNPGATSRPQNQGSLGIYRDAVRSSRSQVVKASGLRWISLMWTGPGPLGGTLSGPCPSTVLAPSMHATTGSADAATKNSPTGPGDDPATAPLAAAMRPTWCWWATAATPSSGCSTAANRWRNPLRSSPACAWTPPSMNRPPTVTGPERSAPLKGRRLPALKSLVDHPGLSWTTAAVSLVQRRDPHGGTQRKRRSGTLGTARAPALGLGSHVAQPGRSAGHTGLLCT